MKGHYQSSIQGSGQIGERYILGEDMTPPWWAIGILDDFTYRQERCNVYRNSG
jgi:hypothetical protein